MTNNRFSSFPIFFTCFALLVFAKPLSAVEGEVVIADIKPGKMELRAVFVNQFEGRMNWVFRGKIKASDKKFTEGIIKYNFRRTGQTATNGSEDIAKAQAEGKGTAGFSRYLKQASLESGKEYILDAEVKKVRSGNSMYPYFLDVDVVFADCTVSNVMVNSETLTNADRKLAGIPEIAGSGDIKKLDVSDTERAKLADGAIKVVKDPKEDVFEVTSSVLMKDAPACGVNLMLNGFSAWNGNRMTNIWNCQATFEPIVFRHLNKIGKGSASTVDYIEQKCSVGDGGLDFWQTFPTTFWDGAEIEIHRMKGQYFEVLHKTKVKKWVTNRGAEERCYFETPSPEPPQEGDIYMLTMQRDDVPECSKNEKGVNRSLTPIASAQLALDSKTFAPEGGSTASMKVTLPGGKMDGFYHHFFKDSQGWTQLHKGQTYILDCWLKQEGGAGEVTIELGELGKQKVKVTGEWKKYSFEFPYAPPSPNISKLQVGSDQAGSLWVDNFILYEKGTPPFRFLPQYRDALKQFHPESVRYLEQGLSHYRTVDALLQKDFTEKSMGGKKGKASTGAGGNIAGTLYTLLDVCREVGANPWINTYLYTDEECQALIEYLAGGPETPYGKIRAERHGQKEPWTTVFKKIYIEVGNECWNSPVFDPFTFAGKPDMYAAVANKMFRAMKKSPFYAKDKFNFIAGGHSHNPGYSGAVMKNAVEADMLSVANYIGGWDGFTVLGGDDSDLFQRQLLYPSQVVEPEMEHIVGERLKQGRAPGKSENAMKIGIYEYGPGYAMPSAEKPFVDESEEVGKSLALGIATLDMHLVWLNDYGFEGPQGFFNFATGINWTSHTDGNSMRPFASWQGLELRNRFCPGDLIKVDAKEVKTLTIPDALAMSINWKGEKKEIKVKGCENIQMVRCYAFQKEKQHSILLLNRSFKETRTVKVTMPYSPQSKVDIHRLAYHEPRATNRDELLYKIESEEKNDFAQTYTIQLPPSSAMVLVNEEK